MAGNSYCPTPVPSDYVYCMLWRLERGSDDRPSVMPSIDPYQARRPCIPYRAVEISVSLTFIPIAVGHAGVGLYQSPSAGKKTVAGAAQLKLLEKSSRKSIRVDGLG